MTTDDGSSQAQANIHNDVRLDIKNDDGAKWPPRSTATWSSRSWTSTTGCRRSTRASRVHEEESEDITALADVLTKVVPLGVRIEAREARDRLGFSSPGEDADLLGQPAAPAADDAPPLNRAANRAGGGRGHGRGT